MCDLRETRPSTRNLVVRCSQAAPAERALIDACQIPGADALAYVNTPLNWAS